MFAIRIPIFVVIRTDDEDTKNRNVELLPYAFDYLRYHQVIDNCVVICNDDSVLNYCKDLGFVHTYKEVCKNCETCNVELNGIFHYINEENDENFDWFIIFNLNQPFKSKNILTDCIRQIDDNKDFLISTSLIRNIQGMIISDNNEFTHYLNSNPSERNYDSCDIVRIVDSSIICIKTSFFLDCMNHEECMNREEFFEKMWKGKYHLIANRSCFINIITDKQVENFKLAAEIIKRVEHLPRYKDKNYKNKND